MAKFKRVSIDLVTVGSVLKAAIGDPNNPQVKLLTEGTGVSQEFIDKLRSRGIAEVVISQRDLAVMKAFEPQGRSKKVPKSHDYVQSIRVNDVSKRIDKLVHAGDALSIGESDEPLSTTFQRPTDRPYEDGLQRQWADDTDGRIVSLSRFLEDSCGSNHLSAQPLREKCLEVLAQVKEDQDALVCLAGSPFSSEYPTRHAVHLASMAMAIGVQMKLDEAALIDLGIGCLIHDAGMHKLGLEKFESTSTVSAAGLKELADHPVISVEIAGQLGDEISDSAKLVAYQVHERLDGSGYPRGRQSDQIHGLAKIASVADAFVALLAPRPHRLGVQGYFAIKQILSDVAQGKFDPNVVRALLQTTSLYPIGSYVELTNQYVGRVIRTGDDEFDKPTIEMWPADDLESKPTMVNLKEEPKIQIAGSIAAPKAA